MPKRPAVCALLLAAGPAACGSAAEEQGPPPCGSFEYAFRTMIPGPTESGFDAELAKAARKRDRIFHAVNAYSTGLNSDFLVGTSSAQPDRRELLRRFVEEDDGWDFEAFSGTSVETLGVWQKSAGLYAGVGVAADAYRYGVLRDGGDSCEEIEAARQQLLRSLEGMDIAFRIDGVPGVTARSLARIDLPNEAPEPTPLFDEAGHPLPPEKNNGQWRADESGRYPNWRWEDSMSRDMLIGWMMALGVSWEVIQGDPSFPEELKQRMKENARDTAHALMKVGESGYDLEIPDADGRPTFHAYLNENVVDRMVIPGARNGFHALMALGTIGALAYVAGEPDIDRYLSEELLQSRRIDEIASKELQLVNFGVGSNFSNFNMAFTAAWLAQRYIEDPVAQTFLKIGIRDQLYVAEDKDRRPKEMKQSFFDFIYAASVAGSRPGALPQDPVDRAAVDRGLETLREFPVAPFFERRVDNCDVSEIESGQCTLDDGTKVTLLGDVGRGDLLVSRELIPMRVRPPSNYYWRSNPFSPNGSGDTGRMLPAVDFRIAYWLGRWVRLGP